MQTAAGRKEVIPCMFFHQYLWLYFYLYLFLYGIQSNWHKLTNKCNLFYPHVIINLKSKYRFVLADVLEFPWKRNDIHILYVCSSSSLPFASKLLKCFHFQSFVFLQQKIKFSLCDSLHCFSQSKDLQTNKSKTSNHNYKLANWRYQSFSYPS